MKLCSRCETLVGDNCRVCPNCSDVPIQLPDEPVMFVDNGSDLEPSDHNKDPDDHE